MPVKKKRPATPVDANGRPVRYPHYHSVDRLYSSGNPLTATEARELLGHQVATPHDPEGSPPILFQDRNGSWIRAANNLGNRPFSMARAESYARQMLTRQWQRNGETMVIGRTGLTLNAQHRLVGLILAEQDRVDPDAAETWGAYWGDEEVSIEITVVYGVEETPDVVATMDTARPRSVADVVFTTPHFATLRTKERKAASRILYHALKKLWVRTGVESDAFWGKMTNPSAMQWLGRHPRIVECARHILDLNSNSSLDRYLSPGYSTALLYLMGAGATDGDAYRASRNEQQVDWTHWDAARVFWARLAVGEEPLDKIRDARRPGSQGEFSGYIFSDGEGGGSLKERMGVLCRAWLLFVGGATRIRPKDLELDYDTTEGYYRLLQPPDCGGIDLGDDPDVAAMAVPGDGDDSEADHGEDDGVAPVDVAQGMARALTARIREGRRE